MCCWTAEEKERRLSKWRTHAWGAFFVNRGSLQLMREQQRAQWADGGETDAQTERQDRLAAATAHEGTTNNAPIFVCVHVRCPCPAFPYTLIMQQCCTALYPQITRRHCSKFGVASLSMWTSQNSSTVSPSVVFDLHRYVSMLPGSYSSTVSVGWICGLYHVSAHSPTCLRW